MCVCAGGGVVLGFPCLCQSPAYPSIKSVFMGLKGSPARQGDDIKGLTMGVEAIDLFKTAVASQRCGAGFVVFSFTSVFFTP